MISILGSGPSYSVKLVTDDGKEKQIGLASSVNIQVQNGQKMIFVVDSPFPAEIAQGAAPSYVQGSMSIYLPKGLSIEQLGLSPYRTDATGNAQLPSTRYVHLRIYDRLTKSVVYNIEYVKVQSYSITIGAKQLAQASIQFQGILASAGNT
jgi:hypothetical protein